MIGAPGFSVVNPHVARNPVVRAVQKQMMRRITRDFALRVHLLREGEMVTADAIAAGKSLAVGIGTLQLQGITSGPAWAVMHGGMSTLLQLCERGFIWRTRDAVAIDLALEHAAKTLASAPAGLVQRAWLESEIEHAQHTAVPA